MQKYLFLICSSFFFHPLVAYVEPVSCRQVKLADIGWSDVTATTAVVSVLLERLGYEPKIILLSLPVALKSLSTGDIDVFLGNWMPSQTRDLKPYLEADTIRDLGVNLTGAKFTLAVTEAAFHGGVRTFTDLQKYADKFEKKIYGIEPGNEGNSFLLHMIAQNEFGLGSFNLVESSEQGMLTEVDNAVKEKAWLVFLAWSPHPMNINYPIKYLSGGEKYFGANFGEAQVHTLARKNLRNECPNVAKFFQQLKFTPTFEEEIMQAILAQNLSPKKAAMLAVEKHSRQVNDWLTGIHHFQGLETVFKQTKTADATFHLGHLVEDFTNKVTKRFSPVLRHISHLIEKALGKALAIASLAPPEATIFALTLIAFALRRSLLYAFFTAAGLGLIYCLGYFEAMLQTLVMTIMATLICVIIGIPIGIICARNQTLNRILSPILDMMQTIPTFVYLLPTLMLFGLGLVPGLISTIVFAMAAPIKFTSLGILQVPTTQREAAASLGATSWQSLRIVEIPLAMPTILAGVSQCVMLSLSMVVISALVGAEGLGEPVVRALNTVDVGMGFESGLAILILAVILGHLFPTSSPP